VESLAQVVKDAQRNLADAKKVLVSLEEKLRQQSGATNTEDIKLPTLPSSRVGTRSSNNHTSDSNDLILTLKQPSPSQARVPSRKRKQRQQDPLRSSSSSSSSSSIPSSPAPVSSSSSRKVAKKRATDSTSESRRSSKRFQQSSGRSDESSSQDTNVCSPRSNALSCLASVAPSPEPSSWNRTSKPVKEKESTVPIAASCRTRRKVSTFRCGPCGQRGGITGVHLFCTSEDGRRPEKRPALFCSDCRTADQNCGVSEVDYKLWGGIQITRNFHMAQPPLHEDEKNNSTANQPKHFFLR